jgi:hypothetical protein
MKSLPALIGGALAISAMATGAARDTVNGGDLAIGQDRRTGRPNVFIAWRNSQRILEVEVEVKNLSATQASGRVELSVLDARGTALAGNTGPTDTPQTVALPPYAKGGGDGRIVQVKGNLALNLLIDKLDRANTPYSLRATLVSDAPDPNPLNNTVVKSFNLPSRVQPKAQHHREFAYRNRRAAPVTLEWRLHAPALPEGWRLTSSFQHGTRTVVGPGEVLNGYLQLDLPERVAEGTSVDACVLGVDVETGHAVFQHEWYAVYDTTPPIIDDLTHEVSSARGITLQAVVDDGGSMLKEASGVRVEYSTDGGVTFSSRIMAYESGNFVGPTTFRTHLGPFAERTRVVGRVIASDIADNQAEQAFGPVTIAGPALSQRQSNGRSDR